MTENHHHDSRVESARLRRMMGSSLITDSYGESRYINTLFRTYAHPSRWMGALANTRWYVQMNIHAPLPTFLQPW